MLALSLRQKSQLEKPFMCMQRQNAGSFYVIPCTNTFKHHVLLPVPAVWYVQSLSLPHKCSQQDFQQTKANVSVNSRLQCVSLHFSS